MSDLLSLVLAVLEEVTVHTSRPVSGCPEIPGPDHTFEAGAPSLSTAAQRGFNPEPHVRNPRLTDDEEGGLIGFRFKGAGKA
ncbi:hypothetical protein ACWGQ4_00525 [Streptomyces sp. NPDC055721]|uniref:hypothetical protein n=1 Tax=Streptomyces sp. NPDC127132 TaxID=3345374 RepID=UPI003639FDD1